MLPVPLDSYFQRIADENEPDSGVDRAVQTALSAVSPAYGAGAWVNRFLHEFGVRERHSLAATVFSVGNITVGGTGKTPFTIWLARWLQREGKSPAVLSRGYGRKNQDQLVVVHTGRRIKAKTDRAGDEPVMIADALGDVPVIACADRYRAGRYALRRFDVDACVLDDGFQHFGLERQGEIVLLDATKPVETLKIFPRGTLREPLTALKRAHLVVLTRCDQARNLGRFAKTVKRHAPHATVVRTFLRVTAIDQMNGFKTLTPERLKNQRVVVYCAVGNPDAVHETVAGLGADVAALEADKDHAWPTRKTVEKVEKLRRKHHAKAALVTEKDAVKLHEAGALPKSFYILRTELAFASKQDEQRAIRALRARLHAKRTRGFLKSRF